MRLNILSSPLLNFAVLATLFCWGVWGILDKKALQHTSEAGVLVRLYLFNVSQIPLIWLYNSFSSPGFTIATDVWFWSFWAAAIQFIALASYLVAMTITEASLVLGVTAAYPVITQFAAVLFLGEALHGDRLLGTILIALGVIGIGASFDDKGKKLSRRDKVILVLALLFAALGWGLWAIFDKLAIQHGAILEVWLAESICESILVALVYVVARLLKHNVEMKNKAAWGWTFLSALSLGAGRFAFLLALSIAAASYVIAITGCYPLLMYFMAVVLLKERFNKMRLVAILLVVAGGILVQQSLK